MDWRTVDYEEHNLLFMDYLHRFEKVSQFFAHDYRASWEKLIKEKISQNQPRIGLPETLLRQNTNWNAGNLTIQNIRMLSQVKTLAIVTGQQIGTFTGPMYTIYKILTVLRLVQSLNRRFPEFHFVPVFWMEVDDHDFREINHIQVIDQNNQLLRLEFLDPEGDKPIPVGYRKVPESFQTWRRQLDEAFFDTEFKQGVLNRFFEIYSPGRSLADAFAILVHTLFEDSGLVIMNPGDPEIKKLLSSLFVNALENASILNEHFQRQSERIQEAGYSPQIRLRSDQALFFYLTDDRSRARIHFDERNFYLENSDLEAAPEIIQRDLFLEMIQKEPWRMTTNVASRPLAQDFLLPSLAYVAGPAEIAYFAQLKELYRVLDIVPPILYPRHHMTIVEKKVDRWVKKHHIDYEAIFKQRYQIKEDLLNEQLPAELQEKVQKLIHGIDENFSRLQPYVAQIDPTLQKSLNKTREKVKEDVEYFMHKLRLAVERKNAEQMQQIEKILLHLFPEHKYQERVLNVIYFLIKYGDDFLKELKETLPEEVQSHWLCFL